MYEKAKSYRKFGGPIQIQSNALACLADIDESISKAIANEGCITGDRVAAIHDGPSGQPLSHFDPGAAAARRSLPLTHVISRPALQHALLDVLGDYAPGAVRNGCGVVGYEHTATGGVRVELQDGERRMHDALVGADGIWSEVRATMHGEHSRAGAHYSGYRCYTATCKYTAPDIDQVAYRVHLGGAIYFVSTDVGRGYTQWYAFVSTPPGTEDDPSMDTLTKLQNDYTGWGSNVLDILKATKEQDVAVRDIYDRAPTVHGWTDGQVALLGDAVHAMMPNLGQGGCMAVEDAYTLGKCISENQHLPVAQVLDQYAQKRMVRTAVVHGIARMSSDVLRMYGRDGGYPGWELFWKTIGPAILGGTMPLLLEYLYVDHVDKKQKRLERVPVIS